MAEYDEIRDSVGNALSQALVGQSEMVNRWVALVEVMDSDGERAVYVMAPEGAKSWDTLGLLMFGVQMEQANAWPMGNGDD